MKKLLTLFLMLFALMACQQQKELAKAIKMPKAARAVANACAKNPYAPKIPCHRVIRSDGGLGGYSGPGGIRQKKRLLRSEKVKI